MVFEQAAWVTALREIHLWAAGMFKNILSQMISKMFYWKIHPIDDMTWDISEPISTAVISHGENSEAPLSSQDLNTTIWQKDQGEAPLVLQMPLFPGSHRPHCYYSFDGCSSVSLGQILTAIHCFYNERQLTGQELAMVNEASDDVCWLNKKDVLARGPAAKWVHVMRGKTDFESVRRLGPDHLELVLTR